MGKFRTAIIFCLTVIGSIALMSAQAKSPLLYRVEGLIASDSIAKATEVLNSAIDRYKAQKDYAPLADLLYSVGKIESLKSDFNDYGEVLALYPSVLGSGSDRAVYRANIAMGLLYNDIGRSQEAYRY